jgi:pimeloyl-ACP methyl ester carboxylesterase
MSPPWYVNASLQTLQVVAPPLVDRGLSVMAFDAPGHGQSTGRYSSLPAFARAVRAVAEAAPSTVVGAIAHSMGGAATALALKAGLRLNRAVFVGSPIDPERYIGQFSSMLKLSAHTRAGLQQRVADRYDITWQSLDIRAHVAEMETRLLVVHDEGDSEVPFADALAYAECWPRAELMATKGLGHRRLLRDEEVIDRVTTFLS